MSFHPLIRAAACSLILSSALAAQFCPQSFHQPAGYLTGRAIAAGDMDGDGWPDLITCVNGGGGVTAALGGATGVFAPLAPILFGPPMPVHLIAVDLDGALDLDVAVVCTATNALHVALSTTWPAFAPWLAIPLPAGEVPVEVRALDFEGDGDQDLAVLTNNNQGGVGKLLIYKNAPTGTISVVPMVVALLPGTYTALRASNIDNAGNTDLAATRVDGSGAGFVDVVGNLTPWGGGVFVPSPVLAVGVPAVPTDLTCADLNGDGATDIAVTSLAGSGACSCSVLLRTPGTLTFAGTQYPLTAAIATDSIGHGDFTCDGHLDLAISSNGTHEVFILTNAGDGTYTVDSQEPVCPFPRDLIVGDWDKNGQCDIATVDAPYVTSLLHCGPPDRCCHVFLGGIVDGFVDPQPTTVEDACPSPALVAWMTANTTGVRRDFDDAAGSANRPFGHSFPGLPGNAVKARLLVRLRSAAPGGGNDGIALGLAGATFAFAPRISVMGGDAWTTGAVGTTLDLELDLADLPGGINLLPKLNVDHVLDVFVQDDSMVDFIRLELETCEFSNCLLQLESSPLVINTVANFTVTGATPGMPVFFCVGFGVGPGPVTIWGNLCLNPIAYALAFADGFGVATLPVPIPNSGFPPCMTISIQAVGIGVVPVLWFSNTWTSQFFL